jgi:hypothetical protein
MYSLLTAVALCAPAADTKPAGPPVDVVICLDVSNSMDGLIASAKTKLWDVVNDLARAKPTPRLRVGLYSYGHNSYPKENGWIRKEVDLTDDLDLVSQKLFGLTTRGGTEYVSRVCRDAVKEQKWSEEKGALKLIFVCGNEPASQDKTVKLSDVAELARGKGIVINPIFCGPFNHPEATDWKEFATMSGGRFINIDQDRGVKEVVAAPQDKALAELSAKLNTTYVVYGKDGKEKANNQKKQDENASKASPQAAASRATTKGGDLYRNSTWDLVDRLKEDPKFDVTKVPEDELCEEMRKLKPEERERHLKEMLARREGIQKEIAELSAKRVEYLKTEAKKNPSKADKAFDEAIRATLREQAGKQGIKLPE